MESSLTDVEVISYLDDSFLMTECTEATQKMLTHGIDLNRIGHFIKDYQLKYISIKSQDPQVASQFTFEMWINCTHSKHQNL